MSHKLAKLIKYNKHSYQASKSASSKRTQSWTVGDSGPSRGSIANVATGTFAGLILAALTPVFLSSIAQAKPYSMTVTIDNSVIDMNVSPSKNGSFSKSSNSTVSVSTTNASGYTLSIASSDRNDGRLVNSNDDDSNNDGTDGNNYLPSITEQDGITEEQYKTLPSDGSTSPYNNTWAYLPSMWDGQANTLFRPSPTKAGDVLDHTTTANPEANKYTLAIGARVDTTQRIGSYSNTYVVLATANGTPYTITYKDGTITSFPTDESATAEGDKVTISSNTPNRPGYTFLGWCAGTTSASKVVHNANGTDTCNGTSYTAGDIWTIDQTIEDNNLVLYAMWGDNYTIDAFVAGGGTMQDLGTASLDKKSKIVASMPTETNYTLKDSRDQQEYTIAKLKDGQIWMTRNLNIAGGATLNAGTSDLNADYTLPNSSTTGFDDDTKAFVYNSGNTTNCGESGQDIPCFSYYSYLAATAGSGVSVTNDGQDAPYSICPKGWRLPTSGNQDDTSASSITGYKRGDFYRLATAYGINLESSSNSATTTFYINLGPNTNAGFLLTGSYSGSSYANGGYIGHYSSSAGGDDNADLRDRVMYFSSSQIFVADNGSRARGNSVRCLLK